jgi:hypothetical protein
MQLAQLKMENPSNSLQYAEAVIFHVAKRKKKIRFHPIKWIISKKKKEQLISIHLFLRPRNYALQLTSQNHIRVEYKVYISKTHVALILEIEASYTKDGLLDHTRYRQSKEGTLMVV